MGQNLAIPLYVFGPETHMTAIVGMALGTRDIPTEAPVKESTTANFLLPGSVGAGPAPAVGKIEHCMIYLVLVLVMDSEPIFYLSFLMLNVFSSLSGWSQAS